MLQVRKSIVNFFILPFPFPPLKEELNLDRWKLGNEYFREEKRTALSLEVEMSIGNIDDVYNSYFTIYWFGQKLHLSFHTLLQKKKKKKSPKELFGQPNI